MHRSARQGTLSKKQRQNSAKSRQVASRHLSPFPGLPGFANTKDVQIAGYTNGQDVATEGNSQSVEKLPIVEPCVATLPVYFGCTPY